MLDDKVNILLVDDQPAKLLTYQAILGNVGENLLTASNATEALELLLKNDVAVVLIDVYMPDIDGFQLAAMIRNHPRFEKTALIFISAILLTDVDRLRGYEMGAVDYVPVPVIPEVLRAKVKVFVELYRKTRQLEQLNRELEARVAERTAALAASTRQLRQTERLRSLALAAGQMGSWEWNVARGSTVWDQGQCEIFGVDPSTFVPTVDSVRPLISPGDFELSGARLPQAFEKRQHLSNGIPRPSSKRRCALVHRHGDCKLRRTGAFDLAQRCGRRYHRAQAGGRTANPAGRGSRSPRAQRRRCRAVNYAADPCRDHR